MRTLIKPLIIGLATARLMRFMTTDTLGEWTVVGPLKMWAWRKEGKTLQGQRDALAQLEAGDPVDTPPAGNGWRSKLVEGLDCPFCMGFWLGLVVLVASTLTRVPVIGPVVKLLGLGLALNYVAAHISSRVDV